METAANVMRIVAMVGAIVATCAIIYYYVYICIIYPIKLLRKDQRKVHVTDTNEEDESKYEDLDGYDIESNYSDVSGEVFVKRAYKCIYNSIFV